MSTSPPLVRRKRQRLGKQATPGGLLAELLSRCPVSLREIREEMERGGVQVSHDALQSWAVGRSWPRESNRRALAAALERIGSRMKDLGADVASLGEEVRHPGGSSA